MVTIEEIRKKLVEAIIQSGMKHSAIANALNISPTMISQYISGRAMPALDTFANLCKLLDVDTNDILCVTD